MSNSDLQAARAFLEGHLEHDRHGRLRSRYFVSGSPEELAARRALAKVLRSCGPLDRELRISLAGLFDPDPPEWEQRNSGLSAEAGARRPNTPQTPKLFSTLQLRSSGAQVSMPRSQVQL